MKTKLSFLNNFLSILKDKKNRLAFQKELYTLKLVYLINNFLNIKIAKNLIYRCLVFKKKNNYFFYFVCRAIVEVFVLHDHYYFIEDHKEKFFDY